MQQQQARARVGRQDVSAEEAAQRALVERLTDAATTIMSEEADVFELHREELEHALSLSEVTARGAGPGAANCAFGHLGMPAHTRAVLPKVSDVCVCTSGCQRALGTV